MGCNSIKNNLDKNAIISSIKLMIGADIDKKKSVVIVEGESDWKFFKKFTSQDVVIYESFSGKEGISEIIASDVIQNNRIIGLRDKDYLQSNIHPRIFFYDYSCLEMMLLKNDNCHISAISECYNGPKSANDLRYSLLKCIRRISFLRKVSEQRLLGIKFKGISVGSMIDSEDLDENLLKEAIICKNRNQEQLILCLMEESNEFCLRECSLDEYLNLSNGHDYITCLQHYCNLYRDKGYNQDLIETAYRSAFGIEALIHSQMYKNIYNYFENISVVFWKNDSEFSIPTSYAV